MSNDFFTELMDDIKDVKPDEPDTETETIDELDDNSPSIEYSCEFQYCDNSYFKNKKYCSIDCELEDLIIEKDIFKYSDLTFKDEIESLGNREEVEKVFREYIEYRNKNIENDKPVISFDEFSRNTLSITTQSQKIEKSIDFSRESNNNSVLFSEDFKDIVIKSLEFYINSKNNIDQKFKKYLEVIKNL